MHASVCYYSLSAAEKLLYKDMFAVSWLLSESYNLMKHLLHNLAHEVDVMLHIQH